MPPRRGNPKRPQHTFAMPDDLWDEAGELLAAQGMDRTEAINGYFAWLCRRPAGKLAKRASKPAHPDPS